MTLGELIDTLAAARQDLDVTFDNGRVPTVFSLWRGRYENLTIDSEPTARPPKVSALLALARDTDGATFAGDKGGDVVTGRDTAVWADPYGERIGTMITGVQVADGKLIIQTFVRPSEYV